MPDRRDHKVPRFGDDGPAPGEALLQPRVEFCLGLEPGDGDRLMFTGGHPGVLP
jgi:hypothetical protein